MLELRLDAVAHFRGRIIGVSKREDFVGASVALFYQASNTARQNRGLAGSCAGEDEHRPMQMLDGFALALIGIKRTRWRVPGRRHCKENSREH